MFTSDADIIFIGEGLLARTLPKAAWTHGAHFAATLWLLRCRPDLLQDPGLGLLIRRYNEAVGGRNTATEGYHETITHASHAAAAHHAALHEQTPLHVMAAGLLAGPYGDKDWLLAYWSRDRLFSPRARAAFVPPDKAMPPFPL